MSILSIISQQHGPIATRYVAVEAESERHYGEALTLKELYGRLENCGDYVIAVDDGYRYRPLTETEENELSRLKTAC